MGKTHFKLLTLEELDIPEAIKRLFSRARGLLLVTGPTGSGKTTSLASMINFLNDNYHRHIVTLEDPVEYYHSQKTCLLNQLEIGSDIPSFSEGIKHALSMAPDVIVVGAMRDAATIHAAIEAVQSGHMVFGALHTKCASATINRIIDVFPKEQQIQIRTELASALIGVLSQTLLPKKNRRGVIAAYEMLVVTPDISGLIREDKVYHIDSSIQASGKDGMFLMDDSLFRRWRDGLVEIEEVILKAQKPSELAARILAAKSIELDDEEDEDSSWDFG